VSGGLTAQDISGHLYYTSYALYFNNVNRHFFERLYMGVGMTSELFIVISVHNL